MADRRPRTSQSRNGLAHDACGLVRTDEAQSGSGSATQDKFGEQAHAAGGAGYAQAAEEPSRRERTASPDGSPERVLAGKHLAQCAWLRSPVQHLERMTAGHRAAAAGRSGHVAVRTG